MADQLPGESVIEGINRSIAKIESLLDGPRLVREAQYGEQNFDGPFMAQFFCRTCGPTNRICADETGFICIVCQQGAAYRVFDQTRFAPRS